MKACRLHELTSRFARVSSQNESAALSAAFLKTECGRTIQKLSSSMLQVLLNSFLIKISWLEATPELTITNGTKSLLSIQMRTKGTKHGSRAILFTDSSLHVRMYKVSVQYTKGLVFSWVLIFYTCVNYNISFKHQKHALFFLVGSCSLWTNVWKTSGMSLYQMIIHSTDS